MGSLRELKKYKRKWFAPGKASGWKKSDPASVRRAKVLKAHRGDLLSAARSKQSLANVNSGPAGDHETTVKAQSDANYFYKKYRAQQKRRRGR